MASISVLSSSHGSSLLAASRQNQSQKPRLVLGSSSLGRRLTSKGASNVAEFNGASVGAAVAGATGGGSSRVTMAQAYICRDCGYIYNKRPVFEQLPNDYRCPVCKAPKRRFSPYTAPVATKANDTGVRKARKEELKKADAALGANLPILVGVIFLVLIGAVVYLSSAY